MAMNKKLFKALHEEDKLADAKRQGQAQFDSIKEMVEALRAAEASDSETGDESTRSFRRTIDEDALSVSVRSGWYAPHAQEDRKPGEYEILLCTGGPACRIVGELDDYCQPTCASLEVQDWFQPWTEIRPLVSRRKGFEDDYDSEPILLDYARCFYFGEG